MWDNAGAMRRITRWLTALVLLMLLGAAGAIEAIFSLLAIRDGIIPPTINYENQDPECDLDYTPNQARPANLKYAISNSFGFGGHNSTLVLGGFEDGN